MQSQSLVRAVAVVAVMNDDSMLMTHAYITCSSVSNLDTTLDVGPLGSFTCEELEDNVNVGFFDPEECSHVQARTQATSDPCGCMTTDGEVCPPAPVMPTNGCDLCQGESNNMVIGDPHYIINNLPNNNPWNGKECVELFDLQDLFDFSNDQCAAAQVAAQAQCQCVASGTVVKQCIPQESFLIGCDPDPAAQDRCCTGSCKYLNSHGGYVCTHKAGQPAPPSPAPAGDAPTDKPIAPPTPAPTAPAPPIFATSYQGCINNASPGCQKDDDCCIASDICVSGNLQGNQVRLCTGTSGAMTDMLSTASGGGSGTPGGGRRLAGQRRQLRRQKTTRRR